MFIVVTSFVAGPAIGAIVFVHAGPGSAPDLPTPMCCSASKPISVKNAFADGFGAMEDAEKAERKAAKKAAKQAERDAVAAEEARNAPPVVAAPMPIFEPEKERVKLSWADCDEDDDDLMGMSPLQDGYVDKPASVSSDEDSSDEEEEDLAGPPVAVNLSTAPKIAEQKQLSKKVRFPDPSAKNSCFSLCFSCPENCSAALSGTGSGQDEGAG
jgi:hypothetical protein